MTTETLFASPWMTAAEAATYLRLPSVKALYERVRRGDVKAHRLGARSTKNRAALRFHRTELDAALRG
jgi:hypothetical protein